MLALLTASALGLAVLSGILPFAVKKSPIILKLSSLIPLGASGLCATIGGGMTLIENLDSHWQIMLGIPNLASQFRLDALAGFFLLIIGLATFTVALFAFGYLRKYEKSQQSITNLTFFTGIFIASMLLVVLAADVFSFMVAWELMSISSYFLVVYQHNHAANRRAGFLYLIMAHISGLFILLSFGVLVNFSGNFAFATLHNLPLSPTWATIIFIFALIGFGVKAGIVPFHVWLPQAHPVAPAHISALMSGVMLKIAIYGFIRLTLQMLVNIHWQWGVIVLCLGAISALFGILYATVQTDLKRLLAYSSVENIGIIFIGLGLSLIFFSTNHPALGILSLIAALFHCLNHSLFKSLLFFAAGTIMQHTHENDLERLGGLIHRMPQTAVLVLIGCLSISSLPLFNGFVSEWLILQAALQTGVLQSGTLRLLIPVAAAILVLTSALAATCFVKLYGVAFLGQPRARKVKHAHDPIISSRIAMGILAAACIIFGIVPGLVFKQIAHIPLALFGSFAPWVTPSTIKIANSSYIPTLALAVIISISLISYLILRWFKKGLTIKYVTPWDCGFGGINQRMQYTATAFAMPIRRVFQFIFLTTEKIGKTKNALQPLQVTSINHSITIEDPINKSLYEPWNKLVTNFSRFLAKTQGGQMRVYLTYIFVTLIFLLWVIIL
jgi:hydrogenase-4 component B